jgi:hypothetical protein
MSRASDKEKILEQRRALSDQILAETGNRPTAQELKALTGDLSTQKIFQVPARGRKDGFEIVSEEMIKNGRASYRARKYYESQRGK